MKVLRAHDYPTLFEGPAAERQPVPNVKALRRILGAFAFTTGFFFAVALFLTLNPVKASTPMVQHCACGDRCHR